MIDFHAHLDLYPDPQAVITECNAQGMYVLSLTTTPSAWTGTAALVLPGSHIRTALGLHPQIAHQRKNELELFGSLLPSTQYVGEIGLDGAPEFRKHLSDQLLVFDFILQACTNAGGRIMSIHSRRAASLVLDRLEAFPNAGIPILHWFTGNKNDLERAISLNCWFSVGPSMLLAGTSQKLVNLIPKDRILTESDGPFAQIDGRNALPWDVQRAIAQLAAIWGISSMNVERKLRDNLRSLISHL